MTVFGQTAGVAVFVDPLSVELNLPRSEISAVYSLATLLAALMLPAIGRRIDRHGVRHVVLLVAVAFGLVVMGLALAQGLLWLAVGFFGIRLLGQGALSLAARTIVALRFRARLGSAVGVSGALAAIGMSFAPFVLVGAIGEIGWRLTWVIAGMSIWLVLVPLSLWFLRPGEDQSRAAQTHSHAADMTVEWTREQAMRTPMFWVITIVISTVAMVVTGLAFHQISVLGEAGLPPTLAAANFVPQTVASVTAIAVVAPLSTRLPAGLLLSGSMASLAAALILLLELEQVWAPLLYALALGGALGSMQALEGTLFARFFGVSSIAAIRGTGFMMVIVGAALGPVIVALVREATGSYQALVPALLWLLLAIAVSALLVPRPRHPSAQAMKAQPQRRDPNRVA